MALVVIQPTSTQTPDATLGGLAVTSISNTGHASTTTSSVAISNGSDADEKSARWFGLGNIGGLRVAVNLKVTWVASGSANASDDGIGGSGDSASTFIIEYSTNGGGAWNTVVTNTASASSPGLPNDSFTNNSTATMSLSRSQDISQVQVRADYLTNANASGGPGNSGSSSVDVTVSSIQVEVTLADAQLVVMS